MFIDHSLACLGLQFKSEEEYNAEETPSPGCAECCAVIVCVYGGFFGCHSVFDMFTIHCCAGQCYPVASTENGAPLVKQKWIQHKPCSGGHWVMIGKWWVFGLVGAVTCGFYGPFLLVTKKRPIIALNGEYGPPDTPWTDAIEAANEAKDNQKVHPAGAPGTASMER